MIFLVFHNLEFSVIIQILHPVYTLACNAMYKWGGLEGITCVYCNLLEKCGLVDQYCFFNTNVHVWLSLCFISIHFESVEDRDSEITKLCLISVRTW